MPEIPQNQRLWNMLVAQARAKFPMYPSLPASKWVHQEYLKKGGRFVSSTRNIEEKDRDKGQELRERGNAAAKRNKQRAKARGR
jgi:hypothetical protein